VLAPQGSPLRWRSLRDWQATLDCHCAVAQEEVSAPGKCRMPCLTRGMRCVRWLTIGLSSVTRPVWHPIKKLSLPSSHPPDSPKASRPADAWTIPANAAMEHCRVAW